MTTRKCSFCFATYTDEEQHDYDQCVATLSTLLADAHKHEMDLRRRYDEAKTVQQKVWWRIGLTKIKKQP